VSVSHDTQKPQPSRAERIAGLGYTYAEEEKEFLSFCNLCGSDRWTILTHHDRYGYPAQAAACQVCGLTVLNPRMTAPAYGRFYEDAYRPLVSAYHGRQIDARTIQAEQREYAVEVESFVAPFLEGAAGWEFLDVGGSTGVVTAHLSRRFGLKATVLDPAPDEIAEANVLGIETITALVEEWDPGDNRFRFAGMFQTVDHLLDVRGTLEKIRAILDPGGLFFVDIVDFRHAYLKNWSIEAAVKIDHPFSLTEETMEAYLARTGFTPIRKLYSRDRHLVAYLCRPSAPQPDALPDPVSVERFLREVRWVQSVRPGSIAPAWGMG
jgi:SAM-dependent methyltransferase